MTLMGQQVLSYIALVCAQRLAIGSPRLIGPPTSSGDAVCVGLREDKPTELVQRE
jgi:hypothetical protein